MRASDGASPNGQLPDGGLPDRGARADADPDSGELPESLEEALLGEAAELAGLTVRTAGTSHEFMVGSRIVATLDGPVAEFRLDPAVAAAALRTPGTRRSPSTPDRIAFQPDDLDLYALDRAVAWLRSAARLAR